MSEPAKTKASYEDLYGIDENAIGQIIDGELIMTPRQSRRHSLAINVLSTEITSSY